MKRNNKHLFTAMSLMAAAYIAIVLAACYTTFHAADLDFKTYPVHKQDSIRK